MPVGELEGVRSAQSFETRGILSLAVFFLFELGITQEDMWQKNSWQKNESWRGLHPQPSVEEVT